MLMVSCVQMMLVMVDIFDRMQGINLYETLIQVHQDLRVHNEMQPTRVQTPYAPLHILDRLERLHLNEKNVSKVTHVSYINSRIKSIGFQVKHEIVNRMLIWYNSILFWYIWYIPMTSTDDIWSTKSRFPKYTVTCIIIPSVFVCRSSIIINKMTCFSTQNRFGRIKQEKRELVNIWFVNSDNVQMSLFLFIRVSSLYQCIPYVYDCDYE